MDFEATVTRFWLVRHAPVPGYAGRVYDHDDVPADVTDTVAMRAIAHRLPQSAKWMVSPQWRAVQTAQALKDAGYPLDATTPAPQMVEINFGDLAGQAYEDFESMLSPEDFAIFCAAPALFKAPNGESFADLYTRVATYLTQLSQAHAGEDIVIITHASPVRAALALALDISISKALMIAIDPLSLTRIDHRTAADGPAYWTVQCVNVVCEKQMES